MHNTNDLVPGRDIIQYSSFAARIELNSPARKIKVETAGGGTLAIKCGGLTSPTRTLTVSNGWTEALNVTSIETTTTVTLLTVIL